MMGFWPNYLDKILLLFIGCFFFLASIFNDIPSELELKEVTGILLSIQKYPRAPLEIRIDNSNIVFSYVSGGRLCGNVYEKLTSEKGKSIKIKYSPSAWLSTNDKPKFYHVYDIWTENVPICTYYEMHTMRERENNLGFYVGASIILISLISIVKKYNSNSSFNRDALKRAR